MTTGRGYASAYGARDDAPHSQRSCGLNPERIARSYDFPDLEDAMPKSKPFLVSIGALLSPWGWGVVATALSVALILFVTWGGRL